MQLRTSYASHAFHASMRFMQTCIYAFPCTRCTIRIMHPCIFTFMHSCNLCMLCISCDDAFYAFPWTLCIHASCNHAFMHHMNICTMRLYIQTCMHFTQRCILCLYAYTHFHAPDACIAHLCTSRMTRLSCTSVEVSRWATGTVFSQQMPKEFQSTPKQEALVNVQLQFGCPESVKHIL